MRKILLGTTAVVGAALLAPGTAAAQQAPTVRIGGYFRAYYGYTQQTSPHSTGLAQTSQASRATAPTLTADPAANVPNDTGAGPDRKSTPLNSSHANISYAVF